MMEMGNQTAWNHWCSQSAYFGLLSLTSSRVPWCCDGLLLSKGLLRYTNSGVRDLEEGNL